MTAGDCWQFLTVVDPEPLHPSARTSCHSDAAAQVSSLREWAMSLSSSNSKSRCDEVITLILPPLRPVKEYQPAPEPMRCQPIVHKRDSRTSSKLSELKLSQLGPVVPAWAERAEAIKESSKLVSGTLAARQAALVEAQQKCKQRCEPLEKPHVVERPIARRSIVLNDKILCGIDPLAGSLFSHEATLDPVSRRKGIYEAQLMRGCKNGGVNL